MASIHDLKVDLSANIEQFASDLERLEQGERMKEYARDFMLFCYLLVVVLLIGKWLGYFPYSYWMVFSPLWIPAAFSFAQGFVKGVVKGFNRSNHGDSKKHQHLNG